jgi:hypothetical protein
MKKLVHAARYATFSPVELRPAGSLAEILRVHSRRVGWVVSDMKRLLYFSWLAALFFFFFWKYEHQFSDESMRGSRERTNAVTVVHQLSFSCVNACCKRWKECYESHLGNWNFNYGNCEQILKHGEYEKMSDMQQILLGSYFHLYFYYFNSLFKICLLFLFYILKCLFKYLFYYCSLSFNNVLVQHSTLKHS